MALLYIDEGFIPTESREISNVFFLERSVKVFSLTNHGFNPLQKMRMH